MLLRNQAIGVEVTRIKSVAFEKGAKEEASSRVVIICTLTVVIIAHHTSCLVELEAIAVCDIGLNYNSDSIEVPGLEELEVKAGRKAL